MSTSLEHNDGVTEAPALTPLIELLTRRFGLAVAAVPHAEALLQTMQEGGTALRLLGLPSTSPDWGPAVSEASDALPSSPTPLVLFRDGEALFLQSWRLHKAEREIAEALLDRLEDSGTCPLAEESLVPLLTDLFPGAETDDRQQLAARTALTGRLTLITGGPGTGKTHTLARLLALLEHLAHEAQGAGLKVALAAPTGKAADRMKEAVRTSLSSIGGVFAKLTQGLSEAAAEASTLHSLLGYNPGTGRCRHSAEHPLDLDLLIVDEASMIDVMLWRCLLKALPARTHLILLGDPNQLESVGMGAVLAALVHCAARNPRFRSRWVHLDKTRRFRDQPGIRALAEALEQRDSDKALSLLKDCSTNEPKGGLGWNEESGTPSWDSLPPSLRSCIRAIAEAPTPSDALKALERMRILTAQRGRPFGAEGLNEMIDRHLFQTNQTARAHNQPIIINRNDPETRLRNGSVGILHTDANGERKAWFPGASSEEGPVSHALGRLPDYSQAWALTIHRSQGSEFDEVLVVLPLSGSPLATRELIYTAITRAKKAVHLRGTATVIADAIRDDTRRCTLLGNLLMRQRD